MNNLFNIMSKQQLIKLGSPVKAKDIILCQKQLLSNRFPTIPDSFLKILHTFNAVSFNGSHIFGISPENQYLTDIFKANISHNRNPNILLLGCDEFDYLGYNQLSKSYQIIDKEDAEVLEEYPERELELALTYILKIIDE
ncbi:MAG: hypothetical protein J6A33_00010 [Alphaproteobacteria bacterium]|nr:hypothetical protein [Alphaproteobacteria bacterium]